MDTVGGKRKTTSPRSRRLWSQVDDAMLFFIVNELRLTGSEWNVLAALISLANHNNVVLCTAGEVSEMLGMARTNYQNILSSLERKGLICKIPGKGRLVYRMINPSLVLKDSPLRARSLYKQWEKEIESDRNADARQGDEAIKALAASLTGAQNVVLMSRRATKESSA